MIQTTSNGLPFICGNSTACTTANHVLVQMTDYVGAYKCALGTDCIPANTKFYVTGIPGVCTNTACTIEEVE
jgi:hypothetical protein